MATHAHTTPVPLLNPDGTFNKSEIMRQALATARRDRHEIMNPRQGSFTRGRVTNLPWKLWLSRALKAVWQLAKMARDRFAPARLPLTEAEHAQERQRDIEFSVRLLAKRLAERAAKAAREARVSSYPVAVRLAPESPGRRL